MTVVSTSQLLARPQPVGVFPLPAGYFLISSDPELDEIRVGLSEGRLPQAFPPALDYYRLALDGDFEASAAAISGNDVLSRANRFVLDPAGDELESLMHATADEPTLHGHIHMLGFVLGLLPEPPDPAVLDGEFAAQAHAARATLALERGDTQSAIEELEAAAQAASAANTAFTGQLLGQLANVQLDEGGTQRAGVTFQAAIDNLTGTDLTKSLAELHVSAGAMYQEMSESAPRLMQKAIDHYHSALAAVTAKVAPETVAIANANLGLAYITMPMTQASDQLRVGVAIQSMRDALDYFTPENNKDRWSSTQLNLANALVYLPSKHQADNIAEAVGLYEGVLQHRDRDSDPQGRARVLANQGNALAHLGVFADAKAKLHESRALFEEFDEDEAVRSVRSVLDEIAREESQKSSSTQ